MKKRMRKKGGLDLSIQTIVIVVLAMTLLGLGLGFIRNQFSGLGNIVGDVQEQVKQQIVEDLRVGNKKLSFSASEITLQSANRKQLALGVQNLEDQPIEFTLKIYWRNSAATGTDPVFVEMKPVSKANDVDKFNKGAFLWDNTEQTLGLGESRVIGIAYQAPITQDTYLYKVDVVRQLTDPATSTKVDQIYDTKTFFVTVT